jgi:hypothetical protein
VDSGGSRIFIVLRTCERVGMFINYINVDKQDLECSFIFYYGVSCLSRGCTVCELGINVTLFKACEQISH